jgi:hypothetical protein
MITFEQIHPTTMAQAIELGRVEGEMWLRDVRAMVANTFSDGSPFGAPLAPVCPTTAQFEKRRKALAGHSGSVGPCASMGQGSARRQINPRLVAAVIRENDANSMPGGVLL